MRHRITRRRQRGLSMVEVMVSVVIGMVVVAAVLVSYLASGRTSQQQMAYAEMNDNAQMALSLLSRDLLMAGYAQVIGVKTPSSTFSLTYSGNAVFGCENGFSTPNTTGNATCSTIGGKPSIEVSYEADTNNTVPVGTLPSPSDCKGNQIRPKAGTNSGVVYFVTHNRYYLSVGPSGRSDLYCASATESELGRAVPAEPLVENIDAMKFWYGVAGAAPSRQVVRYVTAGSVGVSEWGQVVSVRVCVLARSTEAALDMALYPDPLNPPKYRDCDGNEQEITDRVLRRAYFTTATLRSRMPF